MKLPFKVEKRHPFRRDSTASLIKEIEEQESLWLEAIKRQAKDNVLHAPESLRVAWTNRFKIPRHPRYEDYTPEEIFLEMWEQHYFENPESIEMAGVMKRKNVETGYSFYKTGDPLLDEFEEAFGRGEVPDLSVLNEIENGEDIFRAAVWTAENGQKIAPRTGLQGVVETPSGEKMTQAGAIVEHDDYASDAWLKEALSEDPALKLLAERMGVTDAAE